MSQAFKPARLSVLSAAIAAAMYTAPALSQDEMEDLDALLVLEEVIVTAQKRQQTIQSVPSSIAAVTAETITRTNTTQFSDLGKITSGVTVEGPGDGFGNVMRIRGVGNNPLSPFIRPSVGIFVDEVPIFDLAAAFSDLGDVERIEILKGPQATLFGKEVSSGAISIFTKRPHAEHIEGNAEVMLSSLGGYMGRGALNVPITDSLSVRGSAFSIVRSAFSIENKFPGGDEVEYEATGARLRALWEVTDNFSALLAYQTHSSEQDGYEEDIKQRGNVPKQLAVRRGLTLEDEDMFDREVMTASSQDRETDFDLGTLTLEYETDIDWTFTSVSSYQVYELVAGGDGPNGSGDAHFSLFDSFLVNNTFHTEGLSQEFRATFEGDYLSSIIGMFYAKTDYNTETAGNKLSVLDLPLDPTFNSALYDPFNPATYANPAYGTGDLYLPLDSFSDEMSEEWAIFTHNTYDITDEIELTFGLRYSEVRKERRGGNRTGVGEFADLGGIYVDAGTDISWTIPPSLGGPFPPGSGIAFAGYPGAPYGSGMLLVPLAALGGAYTSTWEPVQGNDKWTATTGSFKIAYRINEDVKAYLGVDRGFKAGGFNAQNGTPTNTPGGPIFLSAPPPTEFDSEFATNIELGMKGTFFDNTVRWNSAIYRQLFEDFQVELQDDVGIGQSIVNAAEVEVVGAETEVTWLVNDKVLVDANVSYADAHFKKFDNADCITPQYAAIACASPDLDGDGRPDNNAPLDLTDKRLNATARWTANFSGTYTDDLANTGMSWYARGEIAFRDDRIDFPDLDPVSKQPSYTLLNVSFGLLAEDESWEAVLWVKNLTDEDYATIHNRARDDASSAAALSGDFTALPTSEGVRVKLGDPREIGLTARYRF